MTPPGGGGNWEIGVKQVTGRMENMMRAARFRRHLRAVRCLLAGLVLAGAAAAQDLPPPEFRLAPGDRITVSVFANDALSGNYPVREDGTVALHLVGPLPSEGLTPEEFGDLLRERLRPIMPEPVSATVAVSHWRPVAVLGTVARPGIYEFGNGLDVMRATALAGGTSRLAADAPVTQAIRVTEEAGRHQGLKVRLASLLLEESRLLQERAGGDDVPVPAEVERLVGRPAATGMAAEQQRLMAARRQIHDIRSTGEEEREQLALTEAQSFADRRVISRRQVEATEQEQANQKALEERGLSVASRMLQVDLSVDQYRSNELEAAAFEAAARQNASAAASAARGLVSQREEDITARLTDIRQQIAETRATLAASRNILTEFGGGIGLWDGTAVPRYLVTRRMDGVAHSFTATPTSLLQPGDTLEVVLDPPDPGPEMAPDAADAVSDIPPDVAPDMGGAPDAGLPPDPPEAVPDLAPEPAADIPGGTP